VVTLSSDSRPIIGRGPPLGAKLFFLGIASVAVMVADHRGGYLDTAREWLGIAAHPLYAVVEAPYDFWNWLTSSFADRNRLRRENAKLTNDLRIARTQLLQFSSLQEENRRLRGIRDASAGMADRTLIAEIIHVDVDPFRHRIRINKGTSDGVFKQQPVLDAFGIVGQVVQADKYSAQIILVSDAEHAIPVQVNRNGIRTIAEGTGDTGKLSLPFLTVEADVKKDDLLVSSGLDGIFPAGYPVASVIKVERDPSETFATVEAKPLAQLDRDREVLLLWPNNPTANPSVPQTSTETRPQTEKPPVAAAPTTPTASRPSTETAANPGNDAAPASTRPQ
jgi:rod shape-determining protein MreC